ncbi:hypothetical protein CRG98_027831 [Punica granatum]|uniref:Integrase catalytic domain-containing protein n=1 Tax=Punica granatum TaxID=22663 RepID=A0A2I0J6X3_PUNGR|nr:hypothetical protein CRG98_027831 [Punica granatum]
MWGTFCYRVMPFGLKNAGATYQRAVVTLFHDMMHKEIEIYVDNKIAKSKEGEDHLVNLKCLFDRLKEYKLRLNSTKCTSGAKSGKLLGFVVNKCGIEVDPDKVKAIIELAPAIDDKCQSLFRLLRKNAAIKWDNECQKAFDTIKAYLVQPPVLVPPTPDRPLILYLTVSRTSIKGQAIADYLAEFLIKDDTLVNSDFPDEGILQVDIEEDRLAWKMYFDGAVNSTGSCIGAVLISPDGSYYPVVEKVDFPYTNNVTLRQWKTKDAKLVPYHEYLEELTENFEKVSFTYTPRIKNQFADALATLISMVTITKENLIEPLEIKIAKGPAHCDAIEATDAKPWYEDVYANQIKAPSNELHLMAASWPFSMWGIDVIGPISPKASNEYLFILVAIHYFTKWIEAITLASVTAKALACFLKRDIIARYRVPVTIITDNTKNLNNKIIDELCAQFKVLHIEPDSRGKFAYKYNGPFVVKETISGGAIILSDMDGIENALSVNANSLKKYYP